MKTPKFVAAIATAVLLSTAAQAVPLIYLNNPAALQPAEAITFTSSPSNTPTAATFVGTTNVSGSQVRLSVEKYDFGCPFAPSPCTAIRPAGDGVTTGGPPTIFSATLGVTNPADGRFTSFEFTGFNPLPHYTLSLAYTGVFGGVAGTITESIDYPLSGPPVGAPVFGPIQQWVSGEATGGDYFTSVRASLFPPATVTAFNSWSSLREFRIGGLTTQAGPVPEPGTWITMLFGFGAIGFILRRLQRQFTKFAFMPG